MTHDEFWAKVRAAGPWRVDAAGRVYAGTDSDYVCPLWAACGSSIYPNERAAKHLGIPVEIAERIAFAADHGGSPHRHLLLRELGLA